MFHQCFIETFIALTVLFLATFPRIVSSRSFTIDFDHNTFLKDGKPHQYISGSIHYFRVPAIYWRDRLQKAKAAGLTAVQTYVAWNFHNNVPDVYNFAGDADLVKFLTTAQEVGLDVILRPGPYICAEWEHGGLPWWLLKYPDMKIRTSDPRFLGYVKMWFDKLFPLIRPYLYKNGGPITMVQVENEYGSFYACDREYMAFLRDLFISHLGNDTVLFTTDGGDVSFLRCGTISGVYPTVDFGPSGQQGIMDAFAAQRAYAPKGPLVNSEFYTTWLDKFGTNWNHGQPQAVASTLSYMYRMGANLNFYMFEGGTNFGYWGAGSDPSISELPFFTSMTTSYDYDAPLTEAGDPRYPMYHLIQGTIEQLIGDGIESSVPEPVPKATYGPVPLTFAGTVLDLLDVLSPASIRKTATFPMNFIELNFPYGFVLYETVLDRAGSELDVAGIQDRGHVMLDNEFQGMVIRSQTTSLRISGRPGRTLRILVESCGRQNYWRGPVQNDFKGIVYNITMDGILVLNWMMYPIQLENVVNKIPSSSRRSRGVSPYGNYIPSIYVGSFAVNSVTDTFFDPTNWGKGQAFVNGNNVGRYWPSMGPQVTLYVPKSMLDKTNIAGVFELEQPGNCDQAMKSCQVSFVDTPNLHKPVAEPLSGAF